MMPRATNRWLGWAAAAVISGCASPARAPREWQAVVAPAPADAQESTLRPSIGPGARSGTFDVIEGSGHVIERRETPLSSGKWRVVSIRDGEPWLEETFVQSPEDDTLLVESVSHADRVITRFEPPLLVVPGSLAPGETREWLGRMRVHPIDRPNEVQDEGDASQEVMSAGRARIRVGSGWVEAQGLRSTLRGELRAARVETTATIWAAPDGRIVAERARETATLLGLSVRDVRRALVRR